MRQNSQQLRGTVVCKSRASECRSFPGSEVDGAPDEIHHLQSAKISCFFFSAVEASVWTWSVDDLVADLSREECNRYCCPMGGGIKIFDGADLTRFQILHGK